MITSEIGLKTRIINGIELYTVSAIATDTYRAEAKQDHNLNNDELERKLTGMVMAAKKLSRIMDEKYLYKFGGFRLTVNEKTHKIETISWCRWDNQSYIGKEERQKLYDSYELLGLSRRGKIKQVA